jgi:hypothetical protein
MKTFIALLLLSSSAFACDDQMEQQTQIMQQHVLATAAGSGTKAS